MAAARTTRPRITQRQPAQFGPPRKSAKRPGRRRAKNIFSGEANALK